MTEPSGRARLDSTSSNAGTSAWRAYGSAVALVLAASLVSAWLQPYLAKVVFIFFWPAVLASAWIGGRGASALAIALSALVVDLMFMSGTRSALPGRGLDAVALLFFVMLAGSMSEVVTRYRSIQSRTLALERETARQNAELQQRSAALQQRAEELARSNAAIREAERLLSETQSIARIGSWEWDAQTDRLTWSDTLCELYGLPRGAAPKNFAEYTALLHPGDRSGSRDVVARARETGEPFSFEHRVVWPDGSVRGRWPSRRTARRWTSSPP